MSTSTVRNSSAAPLSLIPTRSSSSEEASTGAPTRSQRSTMSSGKGRRRRAAAEQRRAEQQHWSQMMHESEEDIYVAPPPAMSRRQMRRRAADRRASHMGFDDDGLLHLDDDEELELELELDVALAISLSLSGTMNSGVNLSRSSEIDMSYENLVMLENVKCTAPPSLVSSLTGHIFKKGSNPASMEAMEELCTICQNEFKDGDVCMHLPCLHTLHDACGSEWFLNHSKLCPVCKIDVTEEDEVGHS